MSLLDRVFGQHRSATIAPVVRDPDVYFIRIDGQAFELEKRVSQEALDTALDERADPETLRRFAYLAVPAAPQALIRRLTPDKLRKIPEVYRSAALRGERR